MRRASGSAALTPAMAFRIMMKTTRLTERATFADGFMLGYHNKPGRTQQAWRNLWLQTGDLGHVDERGYLFFGPRSALAAPPRREHLGQ